MAVICPCCGKPSNEEFLLSIDRGRASFRGRTFSIGHGTAARMLKVLWDAYPSVIPMERLISLIWGYDTPLSVETCVRVTINRLRKLLPENIAIKSYPWHGYAIVIDAKDDRNVVTRRFYLRQSFGVWYLYDRQGDVFLKSFNSRHEGRRAATTLNKFETQLRTTKGNPHETNRGDGVSRTETSRGIPWQTHSDG